VRDPAVMSSEPHQDHAGELAAADTPAVAIEGAAVVLGGRTIWEQVQITVSRGEFVAILGPNGAGKSTMLKVILGLQSLAAGRARVLGLPAGKANDQIGYLPQRRTFDAATRIRGIDIVRLGLQGARWGLPLPLPDRLGGSARRRASARVREVIELVGASEYARRPIGELSGGEQQRLLIAQALVRRPRMLILDEPLDSLDLANQAAVAALVQRVCRDEGVAVLLVGHDVNPLLDYLDGVVYLAGGRGVEGAVSEVITSETLSRLYGTAIEVLQTRDGRLVVVGQPEAPFQHGSRHEHA
jgi:zinc/manganese transport system ATP-binding protein